MCVCVYARTLLVAEVHLADILAGSRTRLHLVEGPPGVGAVMNGRDVDWRAMRLLEE